MRTLIESLFDTDIIAKDPTITSCAEANEAVVKELESALHMKTYDAAKKDLSKILWTPGKWTLVQYFEPGTDESCIYLQYNKSYGSYGADSINMPIRLRLTINQTEEQVYVNDIRCEIYKDFDYQIDAGVRGMGIYSNTSMKQRFFKFGHFDGVPDQDDAKNISKILKYLNKLFVDFKKRVSNGEFDKVFEYIYLSYYCPAGLDKRYQNYTTDAYNTLNAIFKKMIK